MPPAFFEQRIELLRGDFFGVKLFIDESEIRREQVHFEMKRKGKKAESAILNPES